MPLKVSTRGQHSNAELNLQFGFWIWGWSVRVTLEPCLFLHVANMSFLFTSNCRCQFGYKYYTWVWRIKAPTHPCFEETLAFISAWNRACTLDELPEGSLVSTTIYGCMQCSSLGDISDKWRKRNTAKPKCFVLFGLGLGAWLWPCFMPFHM